MPVIKTHEEYFCEHCNRMFAIEKTCIEHESACLEEQKKEADIRSRMMDINPRLILFYAKSLEEINDYIFGYADDYDYEDFEYPSLVIIRKYKKQDYEGGCDTFFNVIEFDQYIHELYDKRNKIIPESNLDL